MRSKEEETDEEPIRATRMVRLQIDLPKDMADKLDQLKLLEGVSKRYVLTRALEKLFKDGKTAL